MKSFQTIALSKRYLIVNNNDIDVENFKFELIQPAVIQIQAEVMRYGYMFDTKCIAYLNTLSEDELKSLSKEIENYLIDAYGDNGLYCSLFGNFPFGVMELDEIDFFLYQFVHYLSDGTINPPKSENDAELKVSYGQCMHTDYKKIEAITMEDFVKIFYNLLSGQQSLTSADKENIEYLCDHYKEIVYSDGTKPGLLVFPEEIPFKENLCIVATRLNTEFKFNTLTDILRVCVYMSNGDVSLPAPVKKTQYYKDSWISNIGTVNRMRRTFRGVQVEAMIERERETINRRYEDGAKAYRFKKFSRAERKNILAMIEKFLDENPGIAKQEQILEDAKKYLQRWVRLGEILHPGEYAKRYPLTSKMFVILRNAGSYIQTYNGKVTACREQDDFAGLISLYKQRPGEFARNIDSLIRNNSDDSARVEYILDEFKSSIKNLSIKVLYELLDHFYIRNDEYHRKNRFVTIKSSRTAVILPELEPLNSEVQEKLINILFTEFVARMSAKDSLENQVYFVDSRLKNITLPSNMRTMNFAPGQLPRGTKLNLATSTGILRFYCRWDDPEGNRDLDLSAYLIKDINKKEDNMFISWNCNNYNDKKDWWAFSGDVRHRVGKCAEYVDIVIEEALAHGYKKLVMTVNDYDGQGFLYKNAYIGAMERNNIVEGSTAWAPETVSLGFRLAGNSVNIVACIIDFENMTMTIVDEDLTGDRVASRSENGIGKIVEKYDHFKKFFNVYSLIETNIQARDGEVVEMKYTKDELKKSLDVYKGYKEYFMKKLSEVENSKVTDSDRLLKTIQDVDDAIVQYQYMIDHTIEYEDISRDYSMIFEWMF